MRKVALFLFLGIQIISCDIHAQRINPYIPLMIQPLQLPSPVDTLQQIQQIEQIRYFQNQNRQAEAQIKQQEELERLRKIQKQQSEALSKTPAYPAAQPDDLVIEEWLRSAGPRMGLYPDFEAVVFAKDVAINTDMIRLMSTSPLAADIAYYLGTHKMEALAISKMTLVEAAKSIGRIEESFKSSKNDDQIKIDLEKHQNEKAKQEWLKVASMRMGLFPDFEAIVFAPDVPITTDMVRLMATSPLAADIAYYLGTHKTEALAISKMNIVEAAKSIARIEEKVKAGSSIEARTQAIGVESEKGVRLDIQASATTPNAAGDFVINIQTSANTVSLKIDGEEQGANKFGAYSIRRVARVGMNDSILINAMDADGNVDQKSINVSRRAVDSTPKFPILNAANVKAQPPQDAVAIIIGIQDYKLMPKADFANSDAKDFYDYASRALGIKQENIKLLLDDEADVSGIYKAFQSWLPLKVKKGKTDVYVFYSGHGLPSADGKSLYFLPVGADRDLIAKTSISQLEIVSALKASHPKSVTMFIDSCYSGQIRTGETLLASARPVVLTVQETAYPPDFTVITASASDQIASSSPELKHGIFSYYLMKGLEGEADESRDGIITIGKLQNYLVEKVPRFALTLSRKQEPQLIGDISKVLVTR